MEDEREEMIKRVEEAANALLLLNQVTASNNLRLTPHQVAAGVEAIFVAARGEK
jgi:hypothetical protein